MIHKTNRNVMDANNKSHRASQVINHDEAEIKYTNKTFNEMFH